MSKIEMSQEFKNLFYDYSIWFVLATIILIFIIIIPSDFLHIQNIITIFYRSSFIGMLVLGLSVTIIGGGIDLSVSGTAVFTAMVGAIFIKSFSINPIVGLLVPFLIAILIGLFNGFMIAKLKLRPLIHTIAMMLMLTGGALWLSVNPVTDLPIEFTYIGGGKIGILPVSVPIFLTFFLVVHYLMENHTFGNQIKAMGDNFESARMAGIPTITRTIQMYVMSALLAALAGIIVSGTVGLVSANLGEGSIFLAIAGAVLGGISMEGGEGKILGALGGVFLMSVIQSGLVLSGIAPVKIQAVQGGLVIVALLIDRLKSHMEK